MTLNNEKKATDDVGLYTDTFKEQMAKILSIEDVLDDEDVDMKPDEIHESGQLRN